MIDAPLSLEWIEELLSRPTVKEQSLLLRAAGLAGATGLAHLLDQTEQLVQRNPEQARQLAALCEQLAPCQHADVLVPRARYLRAQTHAIRGELDEALHLIQDAQSQFARLGMTLDAMRTNVGRMNVLIQLGRFAEALHVAHQVLREMEQPKQPADHLAPELLLLTALINDSSGTAFGETGRYEEALRAYAQAEEIYIALEMPERLARVLSNRGLVLRYLGRTHEALDVYKRAAQLAETSDHSRGCTLINIGEAHLLLGRYAESLDAFRQAAALLTKVNAVSDQQANLLHMADAYRMLNLYPEALATYSEAEAGFAQTNLSYEQALALWGMGSTLTAQNQLAQAADHLARAAALFSAAGNVPLRSGVLLEQAAVKQAESDIAGAQMLANEALQLLSQSAAENEQWPVQQVYAHLRLADLALPDGEVAQGHLDEVERLLQTLTLPQLHYRWQRRVGRIRLRQGQFAAAQQLLEAAIDEIEQQRSTLSHEIMRTSFLHDKTAAYSDLVRVHLLRGAPVDTAHPYDADETAQAFGVVERAKSRVLLENMSNAAPAQGDRRDANDPRLTLLQTELSAVYSELLGNGEESTEIGNALERLTKLNERAAALEQEISLLRLHSATDAPIPQATRAAPSIAQICDELPPHTALLSYYLLDSEVVAFVVGQDGIHVKRNVTSVERIEQLLQKLNAQWDRFRAGPQFVERHMTLLERTTRQILVDLYQALIAPIAHLLGNGAQGSNGNHVPKLVIVPHGLLHQAPFHAFDDGAGPLLQRFEISYSPSATIWQLCRQQPTRPLDAALIMGVPDPNIPAVETEVNTIARYFPGGEVHLDRAATRQTLIQAASRSGLLHLACHGLFRADNPLFSALKLHDGWLTATELAQLNLRGACIVLSACESGRSRVIGGDELIGLARAAFSAGANTVVVSQWLVHDATGASLMAHWYAQLTRGHSPAAALRLAQLAVQKEKPHPYYWAAFVVMGCG